MADPAIALCRADLEGCVKEQADGGGVTGVIKETDAVLPKLGINDMSIDRQILAVIFGAKISAALL